MIKLDKDEIVINLTEKEYNLLYDFLKQRAGYLYDKKVPESVTLLEKLNVVVEPKFKYQVKCKSCEQIFQTNDARQKHCQFCQLDLI